MKWTISIAAGLASILVACGGASIPASTVSETEASLKAAERMGAEQNPEASLYLTYAREQAQRAAELADEGEEARAIMMLERAQADAEVAMSLTRESDVQRQVEDTMERIEALRISVNVQQ